MLNIVKWNVFFVSKDKYIYLFYILKIMMKVINLKCNMWFIIIFEFK